MRNFGCFGVKPGGIFRPTDSLMKYSRFFRLTLRPFSVHCLYFLFLSIIGFLALKVTKPRVGSVRDIDLFFTSVSAVTVSSMSTAEMEVFSNSQLVIIFILMFLGGEAFTSMLALYFFKPKLPKTRVDSVGNPKVNTDIESNNPDVKANDVLITHDAIRSLGYLVLCYIVVVHLFGSFLVFMYMVSIPSARHLIKSRGIPLQTFSIFLTVSTFANCGFAPTNENLIIFRQNTGLLLILIPQILLGNTFFAPCVRLVVRIMEKMTNKQEFTYILNEHKQIRYPHLLSQKRSGLLALTAFVFIMVQFLIFCSMEWSSESLQGLNNYQKFVGSLFLVVNARHAGESVVDLSVVSPAILVMFIAMMYLPAYTSFSPTRYRINNSSMDVKQACKLEKNNISSCVIFSQLAYIVIFVTLICITEKKKMKQDPVNFSVLNVMFEVMSAYGNVGFSMGYSCKRRINHHGFCEDKWYGFAGRWSHGGKFILILVMFFGRLKKFSFKKGKAWKLS